MVRVSAAVSRDGLRVADGRQGWVESTGQIPTVLAASGAHYR